MRFLLFCIGVIAVGVWCTACDSVDPIESLDASAEDTTIVISINLPPAQDHLKVYQGHTPVLWQTIIRSVDPIRAIYASSQVLSEKGEVMWNALSTVAAQEDSLYTFASDYPTTWLPSFGRLGTYIFEVQVVDQKGNTKTLQTAVPLHEKADFWPMQVGNAWIFEHTYARYHGVLVQNFCTPGREEARGTLTWEVVGAGQSGETLIYRLSETFSGSYDIRYHDLADASVVCAETRMVPDTTWVREFEVEAQGDSLFFSSFPGFNNVTFAVRRFNAAVMDSVWASVYPTASVLVKEQGARWMRHSSPDSPTLGSSSSYMRLREAHIQ